MMDRHNSQVFSVATSPRCRVYENTHTHARAYTHTYTGALVSSGYRESWILMNSGQLLHSLLPVQLPLACQSKHLLRTHLLKFSHTLEEQLSLWPRAEFPQPNHLIHGPQNSWRARSQEHKSRSRDRTRSDNDGPGSEYHIIRPMDTLDMHLVPCPRRLKLLIHHRFSCQSASFTTGRRDFPASERAAIAASVLCSHGRHCRARLTSP